MSKICISLDDLKGIFKVLKNGKPNSIFETRLLDFLRRMHIQYGTKFELYCTYIHDDYCLADVTGKYREEFKNNCDWMSFGFHCIQENTVIDKIDSNKFEYVYNEFLFHLNRVTGQEKSLNRIRLHGYFGNIDICRILRKYGVYTLLASDDNRKNYYLNDEINKLLLDEVYYDKEEKIQFICSCIRLENNKNVTEQIINKRGKNIDVIPVFTHEWQMDDDIIRKRMEECCKIEQIMREPEFLL